MRLVKELLYLLHNLPKFLKAKLGDAFGLIPNLRCLGVTFFLKQATYCRQIAKLPLHLVMLFNYVCSLGEVERPEVALHVFFGL